MTSTRRPSVRVLRGKFMHQHKGKRKRQGVSHRPVRTVMDRYWRQWRRDHRLPKTSLDGRSRFLHRGYLYGNGRAIARWWNHFHWRENANRQLSHAFGEATSPALHHPLHQP